MIYPIHHGIIKIPLVSLLPITFQCAMPCTFLPSSLLFSMDTPIPPFLFMNLYTYSFYPFIIFSLSPPFSHLFLVCIGDGDLAQGILYLVRGVSFSYFLPTAHAAVGKGTYIQTTLCTVYIILVLHDSSCLLVGGLTTETLLINCFI